jgi:two-component system sensor histidine kinase KdpD
VEDRNIDIDRPNPDELLEQITTVKKNKGKLKIFFGYAAGVGKTYSMLDEADKLLKSGVDVVVGYIEPHTRPETVQKIGDLPVLPPKEITYKNIKLKEFDIDAALARKPQVILVDELAHTNNGVRNKKRYQDVEELLSAGIDVYTTVNVQHIESLNDIVEKITNIHVRETVPDYIFDNADMIKLVDIDPADLLKRFKDGKIYGSEKIGTALDNFFTVEKLNQLREISLRKATDRISHENKSPQSAVMKLLVCIGPTLASKKCIRWTSRMAEAFHTKWIALYVQTSELEYQEDEYLRKNMDLAARLGAEVVVLNGYDVATVVSEYAKHSGVTNIVIGKKRKSGLFRGLMGDDFEDRLIALTKNIDVHIIPDSDWVKSIKQKKKKPDFKDTFTFSWADFTRMLLLLIAATIISLILRALNIGDQNVIMVYILSVLLVSRFTRGYVYGLASSIIAVLTFNFLFTEPYYTFTAIYSGYPVTFLIMLLSAFTTSTLTVGIKKQARLAVNRERRTDVLYEINKKLLATRGFDKIIKLTNDNVTDLFKRSVIFYLEDPANGKNGTFEQGPDPDSSFMLKEDEKAVAHWVFTNQKRAGAGTDTLMGAGAFYMPVISQGYVLGVLGISCSNGVNLTHDNRLFLRMIASQVAMALERQHLSDEQRSIVVESEKEIMRSNLLRAISHDLRTPLTGISGASATIIENYESMNKQTQLGLLADIKEESDWLIRLVENLLSVTRIRQGTESVTKSPEAVEEIVAESASRIRKRYDNCTITVKVPDKLLVVPMDGTLIEQVLINLLENAVKHCGPDKQVELNVKTEDDFAVFEISDNGTGLPEDEIPYIFNYKFGERKNSDSSRGMGIGLSICMSIINAHGGKIEAENKKDGNGAIFRFYLPLTGGNNGD